MYDNAFINFISKRRSKHLLHQKCKLQWFLKLVWRHFKANNGQVYQRWLKFTCSLPNMAKDNLKITLKITALNIFGHLWGSPEPLHKFRKDIWRLSKDNQRSPENCWRFSNIIRLWPTYALPKTFNSIFSKVLLTSGPNYFCAIWNKKLF